MMIFADICHSVSVCTSTIQMHNHYRLRTWSHVCIYLAVINFQRVNVRLHQYRCQPALCDGNNRGYIRIGRYDDLVALMESSQFHITAKNECEGIQSIAACYGISGADVRCISVTFFRDKYSIIMRITLLYNRVYMRITNPTHKYHSKPLCRQSPLYWLLVPYE